MKGHFIFKFDFVTKIQFEEVCFMQFYSIVSAVGKFVKDSSLQKKTMSILLVLLCIFAKSLDELQKLQWEATSN